MKQRPGEQSKKRVGRWSWEFNPASTKWLKLVVVILLGTSLSIAIAISLTPMAPVSELEPTDTEASTDLSSLSSAKNSSEAPLQHVHFPTLDETIQVESLQAELLGIADRLVADFGASTDGLHVAAMIFAEFKKTKRAEDIWRRCTELKPKELGPFVGLASVLSQRGDDSQAVELLDGLYQSGRKSAELIADLAAGLSKIGEMERADIVINDGLAMFPDNAALQTQRGTLDTQLGRFESAEIAFRRAIELGDNSKSMAVMLGNILARRGKTEDAKQIRAAIQQDDSAKANRTTSFEESYLKTLRGLAVRFYQFGAKAAMMNGVPNVSEQWLLRATAIEPSDLSTYMELSAVYRRTNRIQEALEVQQRLLELQPTNVLNHINLASVASQLGQFDLAERVLVEATKASPEVAFPYAELAKIRLGKRQYSMAKEQITMARRLDPDNVEWHLMGAMIAEGLGDAHGMIECLQRAHEITPHDSRIESMLSAAQAGKKME